MAFVKLNSGLPDSSLWLDREALIIFLWALCKAEPHELRGPTPALAIGSLSPSGFVVPPGWYGFVCAAAPAIIRAADLDREAGMGALERLAGPDPDSRNPAHAGRRMVRVDGGFIILNYDTYRKRDVTAAERMRRYRARNGRNVTRNGCNETANVTEVEGDAEGEADNTPPPPPPRQGAAQAPPAAAEPGGEPKEGVPPAAGAGGPPALHRDAEGGGGVPRQGGVERIRLEWNAVAEASGLRPCRKMGARRSSAARARWRDLDWRRNFSDALERLRGIRWVRGSNARNWVADIDWFLRPETVNKLLEGGYDDNTRECSVTDASDTAGLF